MININELAIEAFETCHGAKPITLKGWQLAESKPIIQAVTDTIANTAPILALTLQLDLDSTHCLQGLLLWWWEMGRLYGRSEIVRETMGEER